MQVGSGVMGVEAPVDGGLGGVALSNQSLDLPPESFLVGEPLSEAGAGQYAELDFRHIQPTSVLGGVVELQPFGNPPGLRCRERFVQRRHAVSVQVVRRPGSPRPPDRPRPPAIASVGQSPPSCAVGSPPRAATRPAARKPRTGSACPRADTRSPDAMEAPAGSGELAGAPPTTGWRSRQSRPPAFAGHTVPRIGL